MSVNTIIATGITQQCSCYGTQFPGKDSCDCFDCSGFTKVVDCCQGQWICGKSDCCANCPSQNLCSLPNPDACPSIDGAVQIGTFFDSRDPVTNDEGCTDLKCLYNVYNITTAGIQDWNLAYGATSDLQNIILPAYCSKPSSNHNNTCPVDPDTSNQMPTCSRLSSTGEDGNICKSWCGADGTTDAQCDAAKTTYCNDPLYENSADCACLNRTSNPTYLSMKNAGAFPFNDACWWIPCANPSTYLVTSNLTTTNCPSNVCQHITAILDNPNADIDLTHIDQVIDCGSNPVPNSTSNNLIWFIIAIILSFLLAVVIIIGIFLYKHY